MTYPIGTDLVDYLAEVGLTPDPAPSETTLARRIQMAVEDWERDAQWQPFLSTGESTSRTFRPVPSEVERSGYLAYGFPPSPILASATLLDLRGGLLSIDAVTAGDETLVLHQDYEPSDWSDVTEALNLLRWAPQPITVTGVWGRVAPDNVPAGVFEAILAKGALYFVPASQGPVGAVVREKAGPVEYQYDTLAGRSTADRLKAIYDKAVSDWGRRGIA